MLYMKDHANLGAIWRLGMQSTGHSEFHAEIVTSRLYYHVLQQVYVLPNCGVTSIVHNKVGQNAN